MVISLWFGICKIWCNNFGKKKIALGFVDFQRVEGKKKLVYIAPYGVITKIYKKK